MARRKRCKFCDQIDDTVRKVGGVVVCSYCKDLFVNSITDDITRLEIVMLFRELERRLSTGVKE